MIKVLKIESHFINLFVNLNAIGIDDFKIMMLIELNVMYVLMILQQWSVFEDHFVRSIF